MSTVDRASGAHDDDARITIATELDRTLFVEAGAGTGKTSALVGRIVELVVTGRAEISQVVAITFTEAAAGELRDRVAEELERVARGEVGSGPAAAGADPSAEDIAAGRLGAERALADLPDAVIGTLHAFARRILAEHPFEAGISPAMEVSDDVRATVEFEERWETMLEDLLGDPSLEEPLQRLLCCGAQLDHLRQLALSFNDNWDLVADAHGEPSPRSLGSVNLDTEPPVDAIPALAALDHALSLEDWCTDHTDPLFAHMQGLRQVQATLRRYATSDPLGALDALHRSAKWSCARGRAGSWSQRSSEVRSALAAAESERLALVGAVGAAALRPVLARLASLTVEAAELRRTEGRLEFHDLLVWARRLLRRHPEVCRSLSERWTRIFVDELQDTDPIQIELAVRIASGGAAPAERWQDLPVEPGRLFFVGDPKQSIYRFRRADITQFLAAREHFAGEPLQLTRNYRSVPGIVSWVNEVFTELMGAGTAGEQPAYAPLAAHRPPLPNAQPSDLAAPGGDPGLATMPVSVLGGCHAEQIDVVRREEAADIATAAWRVCEEAWEVSAPGAVRPASYSDIAVLVPTRRTLPELQQAFDARGIPYQLEGTAVVYRSPEVRDLVTVLRAIDDPTDEVAVVAALRTPLFGCGDDDLARFAADGGRWDYRLERALDPGPDGGGDARELRRDTPHVVPTGTSDAVVAGRRKLCALHDSRWWCEPSELVERVLIECRALELAVDRPRPRESWRCLRFVADQARQYAAAFGGDLRRYLRWVEHQQRDDVRTSEAVLPERDHDAVRIMTIHAAKGLEFPVVILAGLNAPRGRSQMPPLLFGDDGPEAALTDLVRTPGYEALEEHERRMDESEQVRLLYVAATRARDHLIVSLHHAERTRDCHAARIEEVCAGHPDLWRRLDGPNDANGQQQLELDLPGPPDGPVADRVPDVHRTDERTASGSALSDRRAWVHARAALLESAAQPRTLSATGLAKLATRAEAGTVTDADERSEDLEATGNTSRQQWRRGRAGTAVGRAVHAVLQVVDLETGEGLDALAEKEAWAEGVPRRTRDVERLARAALSSEPVVEAVACGRYWRELYVGAPIDSRVLEGFVDLLVDGPAGLTVVDYKTVHLDPATSATNSDDAAIDAAMAGYRMQGAGYALAVGEVLGRSVERCAFVFLTPGGAITRYVDDLEQAVDEARGLLVAASSG